MNTPNSIPSRPVFNRLLLSCKVAIVASLVSAAGVLTSPAANITMNGTDGFGQTSFAAGLHWPGALAPTAGNNYFTGANVLRTLGDTTGGNNYVFAGDSLSVDAGGRFLGKIGNGVAGNFTSDTVTINNLILNGGNTEQAGTTTDNATLILAGNISVNAASGIGAQGSLINNTNFETLNITAVISGSAALTIGGSTVNGNQDSGVVQLSAANTYSGTIQVSNNVIASTANRLLQLNNLDAVRFATLNLAGSQANVMSFASGANTGTFNVGAVTGTANQTLTDSSGAAVTLSVGGNNSSSTYSGGFTGSGNLIKAGTGTFKLAGANTYTGTTTVGGGPLMVNGTHVGGGSYNVNSSGILGGRGTITPGSGAGIFVNSGGKLAPGADGIISTLTLNGSANGTTLLTFASGATLSFNLNTGLAADQLAIVSGAAGDVVFNGNVINFNDLSAGALTVGDYILFSSDTANTYSGLTFSGSDIIGGLTIGSGLGADTGDLEISGNNIVLNITAVPEPTTVALIGLGGLAALIIRRRKV